MGKLQTPRRCVKHFSAPACKAAAKPWGLSCAGMRRRAPPTGAQPSASFGIGQGRVAAAGAVQPAEGAGLPYVMACGRGGAVGPAGAQAPNCSLSRASSSSLGSTTSRPAEGTLHTKRDTPSARNCASLAGLLVGA